MIDPKNITNYNRTRVELEEFLLFAICVAGKSSSQIAPKINALCAEAKDCGDTPLEYLAWIIHQGELLGVLQQYNCLGSQEVFFKTMAEVDITARVERIEIGNTGLEDFEVAGEGLLLDPLNIDTTNSRRGPWEVLVY